MTIKSTVAEVGFENIGLVGFILFVRINSIKIIFKHKLRFAAMTKSLLTNYHQTWVHSDIPDKQYTFRISL